MANWRTHFLKRQMGLAPADGCHAAIGVTVARFSTCQKGQQLFNFWIILTDFFNVGK